MKKNLFTVTVSLAVLAAIVIFYFGVISYYQDISRQTGQLQEYKGRMDKIMAKKSEVPSQKWIELYEARQKELDNEIANGKKYYIEIDKSLEKWFSGLKIENEMPSIGDFKTMYLDKKAAKIKELKAKKLYGASEDEIIEEKKTEDGQDLGFGEPAGDNLKKLQKHFWIQEALFASMLESSVVRCERIDFPDRPVSFSYGSCILFNLTVQIQNKDVPGFMYSLMKFHNTKDAPSVCVIIRDMALTRMPEEIKNIPERIDEKLVPEQAKESYKPESVKLPLSRLFLEGEVLDFDLSLTLPDVKEGAKINERPVKDIKDKPARKKSVKDNSSKDKNKEEGNK